MTSQKNLVYLSASPSLRFSCTTTKHMVEMSWTHTNDNRKKRTRNTNEPLSRLRTNVRQNPLYLFEFLYTLNHLLHVFESRSFFSIFLTIIHMFCSSHRIKRINNTINKIHALILIIKCVNWSYQTYVHIILISSLYLYSFLFVFLYKLCVYVIGIDWVLIFLIVCKRNLIFLIHRYKFTENYTMNNLLRLVWDWVLLNIDYNNRDWSK